MRPQTISQTGAGTSSKVRMDASQNPFNASLEVSVIGTVSATVEGTLDDPASGSAEWFAHPTLAGLSAGARGNWAFPVRGTRINQASGTGTTTLKIKQAGQDALPEPRIIA